MAHAIIGDDTGLIKRIRLRDSAQVKWGTQSAERRINRLCWAGSVSTDATAEEQIQQRESHVAVAMRDGKVELWNTETKEVEARFDALSLNESLKTQMAAINRPIDAAKRAPNTANPASQIAGMVVLQTAVAGVASNGAYERRLLTCSQEGVVHIRPFSLLGQDGEIEASAAQQAAAKQKKGKKGSSPALSAQASPSSSSSPISSTGVGSFVVGCDIHVLKVEPTQQQVFACGGKEHMLRIWDIATATATFKEKNVAHDMLNLRQQVWITDLAFIPGSGDKEIVTGTAFHQVRRYDTRVQKRPLFNVEVGDHAITCLDVSRDGRYVVLGDGGGRLQQRDLRMNARMVHVYHGIGGSVRGLAVHPTLPLLATCGLDRFLRVYDMNTRKQLSKIYLKQKLNAVLFSAQTPESARVQEAKQATLKKEEDGDEAMADVDAQGDEDDDDVWGELNRKKAAAATAAGAKKRKHESEEDASQKKIKVKQEPADAAVPASSSFKVNPFSKIAASPANKKAGAAAGAVVQTKPGQIVFRQTVAFDADEDGEDDEDEDGEDDEGEDEEDEEGEDDGEEDEDGEDAEEDEEEEEEEEPEPVKTPARKARAPRQSTAAAATPAPSSTRSLRSRAAPASATPATRSRK